MCTRKKFVFPGAKVMDSFETSKLFSVFLLFETYFS